MPSLSKPEPISRRNRPSKAPLSRAAIVAAALKIAREHGTDAVTMRRVAESLDTAAGSLYVYVANRRELVEHMLDTVIGRVDLDQDTSAPWQDRVIELAERCIETLAAYPGLAVNLMGSIPSFENSLLGGEQLLGLFREGGASDEQAAWGSDLLMLFVTAAAIEQSAWNKRSQDEGLVEAEYVATIRERYDALDPAKYPNMTAMATTLIGGTGDQRQKWALRVLIAGIVSVPTTGQAT